MQGSCLCQGVTYCIELPLKVFQYCHCSRCRKFSGSAYAANLVIPTAQFRWLSGEELVGRYEHPTAKYYATCFCQHCGSSLPWEVKGGGNVVVPAGTLDEEFALKPQRNIFWDSRATWYEETNGMDKFSEFPSSKR